MTISELVRHIEQHYHSPKALAEKVGDAWVYTSHEQMIREIKSLGLWLVEAGIQPGG